MRYFTVEMSEAQINRAIKSVIDNYERCYHDLGNYQDALQAVQDLTIHSMEAVAEEIIITEMEATGTIH